MNGSSPLFDQPLVGFLAVVHGRDQADALVQATPDATREQVQVLDQGGGWWAVTGASNPEPGLLARFAGGRCGLLLFFESIWLTWHRVIETDLTVGVPDTDKALGYLREALDQALAAAGSRPAPASPLPGVLGQALVACGWPEPPGTPVWDLATLMRNRRRKETPVRTVRALVHGRENAARVLEAGWRDQEHLPVTTTLLGHDWFSMTWSGWNPLGARLATAITGCGRPPSWPGTPTDSTP